MLLDLLSYNHPLLWIGIGLIVGTIQGLISAVTANMASRRGLEWQTAFLLSYLPLVPLIWIIYSSNPVMVPQGRYILRWPSIVGAILLLAGLLMGGITAVLIETSLAGPPISILGTELSSFFVPSVLSMVITLIGLSFLVGRFVASWSNILESTFREDWATVFSGSKRSEGMKEEENDFRG